MSSWCRSAFAHDLRAICWPFDVPELPPKSETLTTIGPRVFSTRYAKVSRSKALVQFKGPTFSISNETQG